MHSTHTLTTLFLYLLYSLTTLIQPIYTPFIYIHCYAAYSPTHLLYLALPHNTDIISHSLTMLIHRPPNPPVLEYSFFIHPFFKSYYAVKRHSNFWSNCIKFYRQSYLHRRITCLVTSVLPYGLYSRGHSSQDKHRDIWQPFVYSMPKWHEDKAIHKFQDNLNTY